VPIVIFQQSQYRALQERRVESVHPQRGGKKTAAQASYEKSPAFKEGQRFVPALKDGSPFSSAVAA
jgi:hypothetical protein